MTEKEVTSCIQTIELLKKLAYNIHGVMDVIDAENCKKMIELLKEQPQIVRCKDCTWWGSERLCENSDSPCFQNGCTHGNWFCADGEHK